MSGNRNTRRKSVNDFLVVKFLRGVLTISMVITLLMLILILFYILALGRDGAQVPAVLTVLALIGVMSSAVTHRILKWVKPALR